MNYLETKAQDLAWQCLPKEARNHIRSDYEYYLKRYEAVKANTAKGAIDALEDLFGSHNLTSDTEPEEMLHCSRDFVMGRYRHLTTSIAWNEGDVRAFKAEISLLKELFGDKCLPDKELEHRLEQTSVQVEPMKFFESDYCIGDKVIIAISSIVNPRKEVVTLIRQYQPQCEYSDYAKTWVVQTQDGMTYQSNEEHFEPYPEPETKEMEEKELNLCELLKDAIGEEIYSPTFGVVKVSMANCNCIGVDPWNHNSKSFKTDGRYVDKADAVISLFPSKALYEKYPLDAYSAWMEWKEARKPKRWRAEKYQGYYYIDCIGGRLVTLYDTDKYEKDDNNKYDSYNYFRTKEEAEQAAEGVRKCLEKFHQEHTKQ